MLHVKCPIEKSVDNFGFSYLDLSPIVEDIVQNIFLMIVWW